MAGGRSGGTTKAGKSGRAHVIRAVLAFLIAFVCLLVAIFVALRYFSTEQPQASLACATKLYSPYDPGISSSAWQSASHAAPA